MDKGKFIAINTLEKKHDFSTHHKRKKTKLNTK